MKTKKKFPSYNIESPRYSSLSILYDNLAYQDAAFQANQIIIEFFDNHVSNQKLDGKQFMRNLATTYKISSGTEDVNWIKEMMAESYIVQTYNIAELFLKDFNKQYQTIHQIENWQTTKKIGSSDKKLDPLNQLLANLSKSKKQVLKVLPEFILCDYYRILRNGYVHREVKKKESLKKPTELYNKKISSLKPHFTKYYKNVPPSGAPAPNSPDQITFRDFILFSRALRNLANFLNELCAFSVAQALEHAERDSKFLNTPRKINYEKFPHSKDKLDIYLKNYYKTHFGNSENQKQEFMDLFYSKHYKDT
jgi:hypothetical protein